MKLWLVLKLILYFSYEFYGFYVVSLNMFFKTCSNIAQF